MRAKIELTKEEKERLGILKKTEKSNKIYRRYMYLEMSNRGITNVEISSILGVCNDTLTDWRVLFLKGGLESMSELKYEGRRTSKLAPFRERILEEIEINDVPTLKKLQDFLKKECKVEVEQSWLSRFCKKNSICLTRRQN